MEKNRKQKVNHKHRNSHKLTEAQQVINSLLADGAIEITPLMRKQEPYKSWAKSMKESICD